MKIRIIHNHTEQSLRIASILKGKLVENGFEMEERKPEIIISVGGDGTLLSAFHRYAHLLNYVRFIGVHTGHLGFYTDWREYDLDELIDSLSHDTGESVDYPLLEVLLVYSDGSNDKRFVALNESSIKRVDGTLACDVFIKDEIFERFRGDGLCVSTPTGSTGFNKSIGGAVLHPRLEALQLTEIASLNNRIFRTLSSPMVIAPDEWISLKPLNTDQFILNVDHLVNTEHNVKEVKYRISDERIHFARYQHTHFWNRVEDAFIGEKKNLED